MPEEQVQKNREAIRQRGAAVGFTFNMDKRSRIYNTFDAHRLLHWAEVLDEQQGTTGENALALKHAFLKAYFTDGQDPSSHDTLVRYATDAVEAGVEVAGEQRCDDARALREIGDLRIDSASLPRTGVHTVERLAHRVERHRPHTNSR